MVATKKQAEQMKIADSGLLKTFTHNELSLFRSFIWNFYAQYGRDFSWRGIDSPYCIFVSEVMLQQTQTVRVVQKYEQFIAQFPTIFSLALANLRAVLSVWQGLGYNRRGKFLHQAAQLVVEKHGGHIPCEPEQLKKLPGIGQVTAASIAAFAFNKPTIFVETNIRTVFLYCFFKGKSNISDAQLLPLIVETIDQTNPREWYYALMDYGVYLKKQVSNPSRASKHYVRQGTFEGSDRQIRGMIISLLTEKSVLSKEQICAHLSRDSDRVLRILSRLCSEQLVRCINGHCSIA